jgi:hypothetical protein
MQGALFASASGRLLSGMEIPSIATHNGNIRVDCGSYTWEYFVNDDTFKISDKKGRKVVSGRMQPAIVVSPADAPNHRKCTEGKATTPRVEPGRVTFEYEDVNGDSRVSLSWRFGDRAIWTDGITYKTSASQDIVSLHYFCQADPSKPSPTLHSSILVVPGISMGDGVSPIIPDSVHMERDVWLGRGSSTPGLSQQWGLPVHYFCGLSPKSDSASPFILSQEDYAAFTCGLADLPAGDLFLQLSQGRVGLKIDYRSDLWKQLRGPGEMKIGTALLWTFAANYYDSIASYYEELLRAGVIHIKQNSARKNAAVLAPQFCTWGAQCERGKQGQNLDEMFLHGLYEKLQASGMKAGLFSIDDKWESAYGSLEHSATRFPHFEEFLAKLRADGLKIGLWAALMRCERPADFGLTEANMLQTPEGKPFVVGDYYLFDFTQPEVENVLTEVVRKFIRRYKPDVFKFDFGYELPALSVAAPRDQKWAGELLMRKGLDIVINAMRKENPDLVVMYYSLSPLFLDYFDLHSLDDLWMDFGDYDVEANRRLFFSSLMGRLGVPTYGSTGYDWSSSPAIWFDSAANGTIGTLNDFAGDEKNEKSTREQIARYNGVAKTLRSSNVFEIAPIGNVAYAAVRGAHAWSWARFEHGELVLMAYRPPSEDGDIFTSSSSDSRVKDTVQANFPVIVSSRTDQDITQCEQLAIAPYGEGTLALRRLAGRKAEIRSHFFRDPVTTEAPVKIAMIENGRLILNVEASNSEGQPLEWIEVRVIL